jgi:hypothetical protein
MKGKDENPAPVELTLEVLRRLDAAGVLEDLVLVGSWCTHFYKEYFGKKTQLSALRTRDMDFLIRRPPHFKASVRVADLLNDLGFLPDLHREGYVSLIHPDLIIDFLVAERGKGSDKPYNVEALGIRAQPLRYLDFLTRDTIVVHSDGLDLQLPHPANFALHKLIIGGRRVRPEKRDKDWQQGVEILRALIGRGEEGKVKAKYAEIPPGWRKDILAALRKIDAGDLAKLLTD